MVEISVGNPDRALFERFARGEIGGRDVSSALFDAYYPVFAFLARKAQVPDSDVEETVSDALSSAVRYLVTHRAFESFTSILMIAARYRIDQVLKKRGVPAFTPTPTLGLGGDGTIMRAVLDGLLTEEEAQLLFLIAVEEKSVEEIARASNNTTDVTGAQVKRAQAIFSKVQAERPQEAEK